MDQDVGGGGPCPFKPSRLTVDLQFLERPLCSLSSLSVNLQYFSCQKKKKFFVLFCFNDWYLFLVEDRSWVMN